MMRPRSCIVCSMSKETHIGIDLGGTHIRGGWVKGENLSGLITRPVTPNGTVAEVLEDLFKITDTLVNERVGSIGIGVPGLVDAGRGLVYDVLNIPSWKEVPLKKILEDRYRLTIAIDNDANCFALGEFHFGKGKGHGSMIGLTIGTGLGAGLILDHKLYSGRNGGAGEFGMIDYLDKYYEYYASGQFFRNVYGVDGATVYEEASAGESMALAMYEELGMHLGNAIKTMLYAVDVDLIVLGGSVRKGYRFFEKTMWEKIRSCAFQKAAANLRIEISELENGGILGAAALAMT